MDRRASRPQRLRGALALCVALCTVCAAATAGADPSPAQQRPRPSTEAREDYNATLRQAWEALRAGDYEGAMFAYERVLARADDADQQIRALICLAMVRLVPSSKVQDPEAARIVLAELERRIDLYGLRYAYFGEVELLRLLAEQGKQLDQLRDERARLRKELAARDALIAQLRALSVEPSE